MGRSRSETIVLEDHLHNLVKVDETGTDVKARPWLDGRSAR